MTWTITDRGEDQQNSAATDLTGDTFTPAANCLLVALFWGNQADNDINGITGHGTWSKIFFESTPYGTRNFEMWACLTGSSPSSAQIVVDIDYINSIICQFCEIDETAGFDATVANNFGTPAFDEDLQPNATPTVTATVAAFDKPTNLALGYVASRATVANQFSPGTNLTELREFNAASSMSSAIVYRTQEETTIDVSNSENSVDLGIMGIEVKKSIDITSVSTDNTVDDTENPWNIAGGGFGDQ